MSRAKYVAAHTLEGTPVNASSKSTLAGRLAAITGINNMKNVIALMVCLVMAGCAITHKSHLSQRGSEIDQQDVAQIQPGATDKDWVLRNLGTPDRIHADKDGLEVFEYVSRTHAKVHTHFILLFSMETEKVVQTTVTRVVMRNGLVESVDTSDT